MGVGKVRNDEKFLELGTPERTGGVSLLWKATDNVMSQFAFVSRSRNVVDVLLVPDEIINK